jgi:hypothetical protein
MFDLSQCNCGKPTGVSWHLSHCKSIPEDIRTGGQAPEQRTPRWKVWKR